MSRAALACLASRWHRPLGWLGALALLVFGISGLSHPLMTWFGPQPAAFFPPRGHFSIADLAAIPVVLRERGIGSAQWVKLLPTAAGNRLQVTEPGNPVRRYFDLVDGRELPGFDREQAEWLARYYTGLPDTPIQELSLQTAFDHAYPPVNRLLPVWRVKFATDDGLVAFVHTELNALAALGSRNRLTQQAVFRSLHTFSWLDGWETGRVAVLLALCLVLVLMSLSGMVLVWCRPSRRIPGAGRRWHRYLSLGLWLPLLAFSSSGIYHLLHNASAGDSLGLVPAPPLNLAGLGYVQSFSPGGLDVASLALNSVDVVAGPDGRLLLRLARPAGRHGEHVHQHQRFDGTPAASSGQLLDLAGRASALDDEQLARHYAALHLGLAPADIVATTLVTSFGADYDFRNKRLPVWRVEFVGAAAFIDPANGALVATVTGGDRREGYSFSHLHKWNFLAPLLGREGRDVVVVVVVLALLCASTLGAGMLYRRRGRRRREQLRPVRETAG